MDLKNLEPKEVFLEFDNILKIPRCSNNEEEIKNYVIDLCLSLGLEYIEDESGNLLVIKHSKKNHAGEYLTLQAHFDMVCVKNKTSNHNFKKDPIKAVIKGDLIYADGTSLGADNGIGLAYMLALMKSHDANLYFLFTSAEEIGLIGAGNLGINIQKALKKSKYLINLDSEEEGKFCIGCAGSKTSSSSLKLGQKPAGKKYFYKLFFSGLLGGHSGIDIAKERYNVIKIMSILLYNLSYIEDMDVVALDAGEAHNAIPREGYFILNSDLEEDEFKDLIKKTQEQFLGSIEEEGGKGRLDIKIQKLKEKFDYAFKDFCSVYKFLLSVPTGVYNYSNDMKKEISTSSNLAVLFTEKNIVNLKYNIRSDNLASLLELSTLVESGIMSIGFEIEPEDVSPPWQPIRDSYLNNKCLSVYKNTTGEDAELIVIHAGLECGPILNLLPHMQAISIGPDIKSPHSPSENVSISSTGRVYKFIIDLIGSF